MLLSSRWFFQFDRIVSFVFRKNSRIAKSPFKINWPVILSFPCHLKPLSYHTPSAHSAVEIGESQPLKEGIEPNSSSIQERNGKESWAKINRNKLLLTFMSIILMLTLMGVGFGVPLSYHLMVNGVIINIVGFFGIIANLLIMRVSSQQQMRSSINIIICGKT